MMETTSMIIMVSVFLVITTVSYNAIRSGLKYGNFSSVMIAMCVAALAVVGMREQLEALLAEFIWEIIVVAALVAVILIVSVPKRGGTESSSKGFQKNTEIDNGHLKKTEEQVR